MSNDTPGMPGMPGAQTYRGPEYRRLLTAARRSLQRTGGDLTGRIGVADPDDAERKAIIGITGAYQRAGTRRLTVSLGELDAACRRGAGLSLTDLLTTLHGPLQDRPAQLASLTAARAALVAVAQASPLDASCPWYRTWLADLRRDGTLTRLITQRDDGVLGQAVAVLEHLAGRLAEVAPVTLPALAAQITGDTKALNHGTPLGTLVLRGLAARADVGRPACAAERRELWDRAGVIVDDLASRVLVLNIAAHGDGLGDWLTGAASYGTPFQVTLHQLAVHPIRLQLDRVFVCENPAVLRRACTELGASCPPLVCTEGRPSVAFHKLAAAAASSGSELRYHGDFDWPGVAIASDVIARHGARPWRMGASDYLAAVQQEGGRPGGRPDGTGIALHGEPVPTPWDPRLHEAMCAAGCAIFEEEVSDQLLADLCAGP